MRWRKPFATIFATRPWWTHETPTRGIITGEQHRTANLYEYFERSRDAVIRRRELRAQGYRVRTTKQGGPRLF